MFEISPVSFQKHPQNGNEQKITVVEIVSTTVTDLARSTEKDITGFFEKAACGKAFSGFFINPYCLTCSGCDTFSFFVRTEKDILIHLKSNFISYLLPLRISQNGIFNISIVVMQKIDRFFAEKVRGINNLCSCKI